MIFGDGMSKAIFGKVARYRLPTLTLVGRLKHVRLVVATLMVFHDGVNDVNVMHRCLYIIDISHIRYAREACGLCPSRTTIFCNIDNAIVGTDVNQTLLQFALANHDGCAIH